MSYGSKTNTDWLLWLSSAAKAGVPVADLKWAKAYDGGASYEGWGGIIMCKRMGRYEYNTVPEFWVGEYSHCSCNDMVESVGFKGPFTTEDEAWNNLSEYIRTDVRDHGDEQGYYGADKTF